jgi:hypothetical protein
MWHTSKGARTHQGAEAALVRAAVGLVWDFSEIEVSSPEDQWTWGVALFDALDCRQKIAQLSFVASALLRDEVPPPPLNAVNEATVGMLFEAIAIRIESEIDLDAGESNSTWRDWRRLVLAASVSGDWPSDLSLPAEGCSDRSEWHLLIEMLTEGILWDDDWIDDGSIMDVDPETADARKERLGIADDYYLAVAPDPTDSELDRARQKLKELTADNP